VWCLELCLAKGAVHLTTIVCYSLAHLTIPRLCEGGKIAPLGQWENHPYGTMGATKSFFKFLRGFINNPLT